MAETPAKPHGGLPSHPRARGGARAGRAWLRSDSISPKAILASIAADPDAPAAARVAACRTRWSLTGPSDQANNAFDERALQLMASRSHEHGRQRRRRHTRTLRNVPLHKGQSLTRLRQVHGHIDAAHALSDVIQLSKSWGSPAFLRLKHDCTPLRTVEALDCDGTRGQAPGADDVTVDEVACVGCWAA